MNHTDGKKKTDAVTRKKFCWNWIKLSNKGDSETQNHNGTGIEFSNTSRSDETEEDRESDKTKIPMKLKENFQT